MNFTTSPDVRFRAGTVLHVWESIGGIPVGSVISTATVQSDGTATFTGLENQNRYIAGETVDGPFVAISIFEDIPDQSEIDDLLIVTSDTGDTFKLIALSTGEVIAIPAEAVAPETPEDLDAVARLTSVQLTWTASVGAATYVVFRDGSTVATVSTPSYRDRNITVGASYSYRVAAVDQYGQRSPSTEAVNAFIDAGDNSPPTIDVRTWPAEINPDGVTLVRVNAADADVQELALALEVDAGTLQVTNDPSVWMLTI